MVQSKLSLLKSKSAKPKKPYPEFPLFPHATRRWAKKIRGRMCYFGPWDDWQAALNKYNAEKDDLFAGRKPRQEQGGFTIGDACDYFLNAKRHLVDTCELVQRTWDDYDEACGKLTDGLGSYRLVQDLRPEDFEGLRVKLAKGVGPYRLRDLIVRIKSVFKYAFDNDFIVRPVRFGQGFKAPSEKAMRRARNQKGPRMFEADELRTILEKATQPLKSMILLGINCAFGNADVGRLPLPALDLDRGWVTFPRPKTEVARRCPLWPETIESLRAWLSQRPEPKDPAHAGLVFITYKRGSWAKDEDDNPVSKEMRKFLDTLKIDGNRNFYALRHTFATVGGETERQTAVDHIMGHAPAADDMRAVYRERIGNDRLKAVTDHVRAWLFGGAEGAGDKTTE